MQAAVADETNPELKDNLEQLASAEERSVSQICELLLRTAVQGYKKEGHKYLHLSRQKEEDLS